MENEKFGRLTVLKKSNIKKHNRASYVCKCECGTVLIVTGNSLQAGNTKSCGCIRKENPNHKTHGLTKHPLYSVYNNIKLRCYNPNHPKYSRYGGRGICMAKEWVNSFKSFYDYCIKIGWENGLEIDRIDNNKDYRPSNIRVVTRKGNVRNRENTLYVNYAGNKTSLAELAELNGIKYGKVYQRVKKLKWPIERALIE